MSAPITLDEFNAAPVGTPPEPAKFALDEFNAASTSEDGVFQSILKTVYGQVDATLSNLATGAQASVAGLDNTTANAFMLLDKAASGIASATGLSKGGAFAKLEDYYRREADLYHAKAAENPPTNLTEKATQLIGGLPVGLAQAGAAAAIGGPVAGFAAQGALDAADQGPQAALIGAAKGATIGKLFGATEGASRLTRGLTVGTGTTALEAATGADPEDAALGGATMGLFGATGRPGRGATRLTDLIGLRDQRITEKVETLQRGGATRPEAIDAEIKARQEPDAPLVQVSRDQAERAIELLGEPNPDIAVPKRAVNLNLDRIEGEADFKLAQAKLTEYFKENIDEARRGVVSHEDTVAMAGELGLTFEQLNSRRRGQAFNAEELTAARFMHQSVFDELQSTAKLAADPKTATDAVKSRLAKMILLFDASAEQTLGATAEAGRALSAMRIMAGPTKQGITETRAALAHFKDLAGDDMGLLAQRIAGLDPAGLSRVLRAAKTRTAGEKFIDLWINYGLLSGPQTHVTNMLSNTATALWTIPETYIAGGVGALRSGYAKALGREAPERVFLREGNARVLGFIEGARDGLTALGKAIHTGQESELFSQQSKVEYPTRRLPGRLLMAEDELFKNIGYRQELHARAVRAAASEGLTGTAYRDRVASIIEDPPPAIKQAALDNADYQTFTSKLGPVGSSVMGFSNSHPAVKLILPFVRTPTNIFKFALERTPVAALMRETVVEKVRKGGPDSDTIHGRLAFAAGTLALLSSEVIGGRITGAGPSNPEERRIWLLNHQPYSVKVGDKWVSYGRVEPLASLLGLTADYSEIVAHMDDEEQRDRVAVDLTLAITRNLTNKTFVSGLTRALLALNDPERYGETWAESMASSLIPAGVAQVNRALSAEHGGDPIIREVDGILDSVKARVPSYSATLPPKRNVWGEALTYNQGIGPDIASPLYSSSAVPDPVSVEVERAGARLGLPTKEVQGVPLTTHEYSTLQQMVGVPAKQAITKLITGPGYRDLPDPIKKQLIETVYAKVRDSARSRMLVHLLQTEPGRVADPIVKHINELKQGAK